MIYPKLPVDDYSLVIRTDFSSEATWQAVCEAIQIPQRDGFQAMIQCISDKACTGLSPDAVWSLLPDGFEGLFVFIVDETTISNPEHPVLVADFSEKPGLTFRVVPAEAWAVENNLRLANMGYDDFEQILDADGILRNALR